MNATDLDKALQLALEIEGLIMLMQARDESAPEEISHMLEMKTNELASVFSSGINIACEQIESSESSSLESDGSDNTIGKPDKPDESPESPESIITEAPAIQNCDEPEEIHLLADRIAGKAAQELKRAFTLNDRYRFCREIFAGNSEDLNGAIDTINAMATYDQAEQWMIEVMNVDTDDSVVKEFMSIVAKHFNK